MTMAMYWVPWHSKWKEYDSSECCLSQECHHLSWPFNGIQLFSRYAFLPKQKPTFDGKPYDETWKLYTSGEWTLKKKKQAKQEKKKNKRLHIKAVS